MLEFGGEGEEASGYKILERSVAGAHLGTVVGGEFVGNVVWNERLELEMGIEKGFKSQGWEDEV
jgi:hypothetical protein